MSDELKDAICTIKGMKRVHGVKKYRDNMDVFTQEEHCSFNDIFIQAGEYTREEWKDNLETQGFCPISVEKILDELETYYTEENDFFAE